MQPMTQLNTLFPGRPNYTGPTEGWFGLLHHSNLYECSHNVMERVAYVIRKKAPQVEIRLHNMIYLGDLGTMRDAMDTDYGDKRDALRADYRAKCNALWVDYEDKRDPMRTDYTANCIVLEDDYAAKCRMLDADYKDKIASLEADILVYIKHHIPDCAWNGTKLVFGK
jgi:hypothetical protein